jgi:LysM repeat protein
MHFPASSRLLILGGLLVVIVTALGRVALRPRDRAAHPAPGESFPDLAMPPNLARDPFLGAPPKPAPIVAPRPSVRGEALLATIAIGAYVAVFGMSLLGGENTPDLLSIRGGGSTRALTADVLSIQVIPTPTASPVEEAMPPGSEVAQDQPVLEPTPAPEPPRPARHVLRSGETLISVAALYGVTAYDLAAANGLTTDRILAGQVLKIPAQ